MLSKKLSLPINNSCIIRALENKTQHFLNRKQRNRNTKNIFQVVGAVPKRIVIIDDILTTGATVKSLSQCLNDAGAESIEVWIIAKTL